MKQYQELNAKQLENEYGALLEEYRAFMAKGLSLDMSRGKPNGAQLDLSTPMFDSIDEVGYYAQDGTDTRNYGGLDGLPEAKALFAEMLDVPVQNIIVGGNSSLTMMYDTIARAMNFGICGSAPWNKLKQVKFLCPVPGYDRHFAITESFGIELVPIEMKEDGPDMKRVKALVETDDTIKGIWCVPKYSNPTGITFSDDVVRAFASLEPKAADFRIYWDNAYCVHHLTDTPDELLNLYRECAKTGNEDLPFIFTSTSKITFSGAGISAMAASEANLDWVRSTLTIQTIGPDKINQLRHVAFLKNLAGIEAHMKRHQALLAPKFQAVLDILDKEIAPLGIATYSRPNGGYFISFNAMPGCATRIYNLCQEAGLVLTTVGATFPYGKDAEDSNIRIAPSFPCVEELELAVKLFSCAVRLASIEKLIAKLAA